ncbi:MAG: TetR family transcriptional regulator [Rhodospirillaceae bacterium]|nr:TetR family transcriptional regulator [Rhodospirillaceae bacterium]|tara:strand:- start:2338 stop:2958 length:621 start_codon:yes stop_codon:yes gene_type:complete
MARTPRFTREDPDVRRQALIDATRRCMARDGVEGASVRRICEEAGVSQGLLRHHFGSKDNLMAETYRAQVLELEQATRGMIGRSDLGPAARLSGAIEASLRPPLAAPERRRVQLAFWDLVPRNPAIAAMHKKLYGDYRRDIARVIAEVACADGVDVDARAEARALTALLDGLWLQMCLEPKLFSVRRALGECHRLLGRSLPSLADR